MTDYQDPREKMRRLTPNDGHGGRFRWLALVAALVAAVVLVMFAR